jgi:mannosyltransferase
VSEPPASSPKAGFRESGSLCYRFLGFGLLLAACILRLLSISRFSLGNDEIQEIRFSRLPWLDIARSVKDSYGHPPLEFFLQAMISRTGAAEWVHRIPSVLAGVAGISLAMLLARSWFGRSASLVTGILMAFSPTHVRYSQEIRPYALGLCLLLASVAALEQYRRKPDSRFTALWFASTLGAMYTLYFAGMIAVLVGVLFVAQNRKDELRTLWKKLPVLLGGLVVFYLPWLPAVAETARQKPVVPPEVLDRAWLTYRMQTLGTGDWKLEPISVGSMVFWILVILGVGLAYRSRFAVLVTAWLVVGGSAQVLFLRLHPHWPAVRYLTPTWIASFLLVGFLIQLSVRHRSSRIPGFVALFVIVAFDLRTLIDYYDHGRPQWKAVVLYLRSVTRPGEHIAANDWAFRNAGFYWEDEHLGRKDVTLERAVGEIVGPAWVVTVVCPMDADLRSQWESLELRASLPMTNHCEIRYLPAGRTLHAPAGLCEGG